MCRNEKRGKENFQPLDFISFFFNIVLYVSRSMNVYMLRNIKLGIQEKVNDPYILSLTPLLKLCVSVTLCASLLPFLTTQKSEFSRSLSFSLLCRRPMHNFIYSEFLSFYCLHTRACKNLIYAFFCPCFTYYSELSILIKYFFSSSRYLIICAAFL